MTTTLTPTAPPAGLDLEPATYEQWVTAGRILTTQHSGLHWLIGDWVAYGAERWEDRWLQAAATVGIPHTTLAQAAQVAAAWPEHQRRPGLSWSHHRAALAGDEPHQWLDRTERHGWTVRQLEQRIREARELETAEDELDGMPPRPKIDRAAAARYLADGITRVVVDLVTGDMRPA